MNLRKEPWYIHAVLIVIMLILAYVLIQVAIIQPQEIMEKEKYYKSESRLRMMNLREAQILWEKKHKSFSDNIDSLIHFIKTDEMVAAVITGTDSITGRPSNPFKLLTHGEFNPDSLYYSPKSFLKFLVQVDTSISRDTIINAKGKILKVDSTRKVGTKYVILSPDNDDKIGDLKNDALRNTASWE